MRPKRLLASIMGLLLLWAAVAHADAPGVMNVQGRLTDDTGLPLPAGTRTLHFAVYSDSVSGALIWPEFGTESHEVYSDEGGLWSVLIGTIFPLNSNVFADSTRWLQVSVEDAVKTLTVLPRIRFATGPYAYRVASIDGARGGNITTEVNIGPNNTLSGSNAFVAGTLNEASGVGSAAVGGAGNHATNLTSVAVGGSNNNASGHHSFATGESNTASGAWSSVTGGSSNLASGSQATVAGGGTNAATGSGSFVGGGSSNWGGNSGAAVVGGSQNLANAPHSAIVGGYFHEASGDGAFIGGGAYNKARGPYSAVLGGGSADPADSNAALGEASSVGGGRRNTALEFAARISGGEENSATGRWSTISGGYMNEADSGATVGGGAFNQALGSFSLIAGGGGGASYEGNTATGRYSSILGGRRNEVAGFYSTVGGGFGNFAQSTSTTVSGGQDNTAFNIGSTVGGGGHNIARGYYSTIAGGGSDNDGDSNSALGGYSSIGGGRQNAANGTSSTVGGGQRNWIDGENATISGGFWNEADGASATIPGGAFNRANGSYSFAAGRFAYATHRSSFVWADSGATSFQSSAPNQFLIRAQNGVGINTNSTLANLTIQSDDGESGIYFDGGLQDITWAPGERLQFGEWDGVTFTERMRMNPSGYLGIGTTGPIARLHISATTLMPALHISGSAYDVSWPYNQSFQFGQWDGVTFTEHVRIGPNGDFGIGLGGSTPNHILQIQQNSSTDPIADGWTTYSSRRWKHDIKTIHAALDKVGRLRGVTYKWNADNKPDIGLIAEEVGKVIPEIVTYEENGVDAESVDYARLVALLIQGMKEQQQMIESQAERLERLEAQLERMQP